MTTEQEAKAVAIAVLGEPVGSKVTRITTRPATPAEQAPFASGTLRLGDWITFEMEPGT